MNTGRMKNMIEKLGVFQEFEVIDMEKFEEALRNLRKMERQRVAYELKQYLLGHSGAIENRLQLLNWIKKNIPGHYEFINKRRKTYEQVLEGGSGNTDDQKLQSLRNSFPDITATIRRNISYFEEAIKKFQIKLSQINANGFARDVEYVQGLLNIFQQKTEEYKARQWNENIQEMTAEELEITVKNVEQIHHDYSNLYSLESEIQKRLEAIENIISLRPSVFNEINLTQEIIDKQDPDIKKIESDKQIIIDLSPYFQLLEKFKKMVKAAEKTNKKDLTKLTIEQLQTDVKKLSSANKSINNLKIKIQEECHHLIVLHKLSLPETDSEREAQKADGIIKARCRSVHYVQAGRPDIITGIKGSYDEPRNAVAGGYGTYVTRDPANLILTVEIDGKEYEIWIKRFFQDRYNNRYIRLTENNRNKIASHMPSEIKVKKQVSSRGTEYYTIADTREIEAWYHSVAA